MIFNFFFFILAAEKEIYDKYVFMKNNFVFIVHVDLADGKRLTKRVDYPLGHARNPLKDSEVEGKFTSLVAPALGESGAKKIVDLVWKLDEAKNVDELMGAVVMK